MLLQFFFICWCAQKEDKDEIDKNLPSGNNNVCISNGNENYGFSADIKTNTAGFQDYRETEKLELDVIQSSTQF